MYYNTFAVFGWYVCSGKNLEIADQQSQGLFYKQLGYWFIQLVRVFLIKFFISLIWVFIATIIMTYTPKFDLFSLIHPKEQYCITLIAIWDESVRM